MAGFTYVLLARMHCGRKSFKKANGRVLKDTGAIQEIQGRNSGAGGVYSHIRVLPDELLFKLNSS